MIKKQELDNKIINALSILKSSIQMSNKNGNFDINKYCEDFFAGLLNLVYDINLVNLNDMQVNFPAIDLGDEKSGICYQITATSELDKIVYTIDKFHEKGLDEKYSKLNIFILGEKKNHTKSIPQNKVLFSYENNLHDFNTLSAYILNINDTKKLENIYKMLNDSLSIYGTNLNESKNDDKEILSNILTLLSDEIKSNISALYSIKNVVNGETFGIKEILETITEDKFVPNEFHQPFLIAINTKEYEKVEQKLLELQHKNVKWILDLYKQFRLIEEKSDLLYFRKDEYTEFRRVILAEMNKYDVKF